MRIKFLRVVHTSETNAIFVVVSTHGQAGLGGLLGVVAQVKLQGAR